MSPRSFGNLGAGAALSARESAPTSAQRRPALNASASAPARGDFCPALLRIMITVYGVLAEADISRAGPEGTPS